LFFCFSAAVFAQSFEVASIKPNNTGDRGSSSNTNKGEMTLHNVTLKQLVQRAYGVEDYSTSAPEWLSDVHFDIMAKMPDTFAAASDNKARLAQFQTMMQTMLKERFKIEVHHEPKTVAGFVLVVAKGGLKVTPEPETDGRSGTSQNNGHLKVTRIKMEDFAVWVTRQVGRPVVDKTDVAGAYSFEFDFAQEERSLQTDPAKAAESAPQGPTIYTVLQEQIGLRLQSQKVPVDVVVVDHIERVPTEN